MDEQLRQLIAAVCGHPLKSLKRRKAMNQLLVAIQRLPGLGTSSHPDYLDALNRTWEWVNRSICQEFHLVKPSIQKRLLQWINSYLLHRTYTFPDIAGQCCLLPASTRGVGSFLSTGV
jgi:hypothetical protein